MKNDPINPNHYRNHPSGLECIEVCEHMSYNLGAAFKYLWRLGMKNEGSEEIAKAQWYVKREYDRLINGEHLLPAQLGNNFDILDGDIDLLVIDHEPTRSKAMQLIHLVSIGEKAMAATLREVNDLLLSMLGGEL